MPTKQELENLNIIYLAVLCQQVADSPTADEKTAQKGWQLKREWVVLVGRESPSAGSYQEHEKVQAEKEELKKRMAEFLALYM
jgi:hypothetical protein